MRYYLIGSEFRFISDSDLHYHDPEEVKDRDGSGRVSVGLRSIHSERTRSSVDSERKSRDRERGNRGEGREEAMIGVGKIKQYTNVLDKPLSRGRQEVSFCSPPPLSFFLFYRFYVVRNLRFLSICS